MIFRPFKLTCSNTITDSLLHMINYLLLFECDQLVNEREEEDTATGERRKIGSIILWFITLSSGAMERVEPGWWMRSLRGLMNTDRCWADWATQWSPPQLQPPAPVLKSPVDWSLCCDENQWHHFCISSFWCLTADPKLELSCCIG